MAAGPYVAASRRLRLRPLTRDDLELVAGWLAAGDEYLGADERLDAETLAAALAWSEADPSVRLWALEDADGEVVGMASWRPDLPWSWVLELEFMLAPELRGRGYGFEASALVIDHLFATTDAAKMLVRISALNRPAFPVIRRLGGEEEGRLRRHLRIGGAEVDLVVYGLLREDWERAARARQRLLSVPDH